MSFSFILDHAQVAIPGGAEADAIARHFYSGELGLKEIQKPESLRARGGMWFELSDGRQLHLGVDPDFQPSRKAHLALGLEYESLKSLFARLDRTEAASPAWDEALLPRRRFYAADPFGNRTEFIESRIDP